MGNGVGSLRMRKTARLLLTVAVIASLLLTTGCGDSRDDELVGRWVFELDSSWVTTFNADGTGVHALDWGYGTTFRWSTGGGNLTWNYPNHPDVYTPYRISGNALYLTMDDGTVFRYIRD